VPTIHEVNQCVQQEADEPQGGIVLALRLLQLLPYSPDIAGHSCHGRGDHWADMGDRRVAKVALLANNAKFILSRKK
jgi:hypothetical protein